MLSTPPISQQNPLWQRIQTSLKRQGLMTHLGTRLLRVEKGLVELALPYSDKVTQQQGGFHGGAIGALADIAAGYAGLSTLTDDVEVVTVEYKINFLNACRGGELRAVGRAIKTGRRVIVTTADVVHVDETGQQNPCAIMQQTLASVPKTY